MLYRLIKGVFCVVVGTFGGMLMAGLYADKQVDQKREVEGIGPQAALRVVAGFMTGMIIACRRHLPSGSWRWLAAGSAVGAAVAPSVVDFAVDDPREPSMEHQEQVLGLFVGLLFAGICTGIIRYRRSFLGRR